MAAAQGMAARTGRGVAGGVSVAAALTAEYEVGGGVGEGGGVQASAMEKNLQLLFWGAFGEGIDNVCYHTLSV